MRSASSQLVDALGGSFQKWYEADIFYDGERVIEGAPVTSVQLNEDDGNFVKASGSCTVTIQDVIGRSSLPKNIGDVLSPFGSEVVLYAVVSAGAFLERVKLATLQITDVPDMRDAASFFRGRRISIGSTIELTLQDRFVQIQRDNFDVPGSPSQTASVLNEISRLVDLPMVRSVADARISATVAYSIDDGGRAQAVLDLSDVIDAIPYANSDGYVQFRTKSWPAPVDTLTRGDGGQIVSIGRGMSSDGVYNRVVFRGEDGSTSAGIFAYSEITTGPLRVRNLDGSRSPAHRRTYAVSNQFIATKAQAQAYTDSTLARVSKLQAITWPVIEKWNPLRELGDVLTLDDEWGDSVTARIVKIDRDEGQTQTVTVQRA